MTAQELALQSSPTTEIEQQTGGGVSASPPVENSDIDYSTPAILPEDDALSRLDWHMRMVRKYRAEVAELDDVYLAEMDRMRDRYANRRRIIEDKSRWHQAPIESYHRAHPDQRTIELPHGASKLSVPKTPKVFMNGEHNEAVTEWARKAHPEIMKGPNITDVRKVVDIKDHNDGTFTVVDPTTGEVVPGVTAQIPLPSWSLDVEPGSPF